MNRIPLCVLLMLGAAVARAESVIELEGTEVRGNPELPHMLYIVPWKPSKLPALSEPPLQGLIDEALEPLDRREFRRRVRYYENLQRQASGSGK